MIRRILTILAGVFVALSASADTFNLFSPSNGVLKGSTTTYVTSPALSSDIIPLWSGTCNDTTYLRGDGSCQTPPGTGGGTVDSVALTAPSVFSVTGSPVTSTGTLALDFAAGQTANRFLATPNGSTGALSLRAIVAADLPAISLTTGVSGTLPVANGGTGVATITGPIKGNGTSAFSVAAAADIYGLWSGTCNSSSFLRGDGSCAATGTVTSVALTVPSGFNVTGSPITTSGTLAIGGTLNVSAGGSGVGTITGPIKGNGTSAFSSAAAADIYGLWSGLCSSTTYLRGDGTCQTPDGTSSPANPTATVGLSAVNGSAGTFMRSDAAPALSQAITPTWTGAHTFNAATTFGAKVTGTTSTFVGGILAVASGTSQASQDFLNSIGGAGVTNVASWNANPSVIIWETDATTNEAGWRIDATSGTLCIRAVNDAGGVGGCAFSLDRSGSTISDVTIGGTSLTVGGISMTPGSGTYTGTFTGFDATTPTSTIRYVKVGSQVSISIDAFSGTSNTSTMTENSGSMPTFIRPARIQGCPMFVINGNFPTTGYAEVQTNGNILFRAGNFSSVFNSSGTKGVGSATQSTPGTCTYITI